MRMHFGSIVVLFEISVYKGVVSKLLCIVIITANFTTASSSASASSSFSSSSSSSSGPEPHPYPSCIIHHPSSAAAGSREHPRYTHETPTRLVGQCQIEKNYSPSALRWRQRRWQQQHYQWRCNSCRPRWPSWENYSASVATLGELLDLSGHLGRIFRPREEEG